MARRPKLTKAREVFPAQFRQGIKNCLPRDSRLLTCPVFSPVLCRDPDAERFHASRLDGGIGAVESSFAASLDSERISEFARTAHAHGVFGHFPALASPPPDTAGRTSRGWTIPTSFLLGGAFWLRWSWSWFLFHGLGVFVGMPSLGVRQT